MKDIVKTNDWSTEHMRILSKQTINLPDTCGFEQNHWSTYRTHGENDKSQNGVHEGYGQNQWFPLVLMQKEGNLDNCLLLMMMMSTLY
jgi:hypothetical protein